jgi:pimeloyl-ACP methyl ester carboxylesterase
VALGLVVVAVGLWSGWTERHPLQERHLRSQVQEQLETRFPVAMQPRGSGYGIFRHITSIDPERRPGVLLVHGLDEPGGIWADLLPVLGAAGFDTWEFRYPNDQGIDDSADLLASSWSDIPAGQRLVMVGHSMGGLVIRDFVSRWRHPVAFPPRLAGAAVQGVILAGTPNHGSDWARLRVWLELRDQWAAGQQSGFSPLGGLRDGTGAAKIDLVPGSWFLDQLNARPWPVTVPIRIIGGILLESTPTLGDGVVAAESLAVSGAPEPIMVGASHRGMLKRVFPSDPEPPAIPHIMALLDALSGQESWSSQ